MNQRQHDMTGGRTARPTDKELKRCRECGTIGYDHDLHCPHCGARFGPLCDACGAMVAHPVAFFCVRCGKRLEHSKNPPC